MKNQESNKIILKASAGTGKTYRLSLEYIYNLLKNIDFKNIVVVTFTKKATAEIKERIFDFLYQVAFEKSKGTLTPKGFSVSCRTFAICSLRNSPVIEPAPSTPSPPLLETALAKRQPLHQIIPP